MKAFEISKEAREDLRKIARFTEKRWGRDQRFLYIKQFDDVFHLLAKTPTMGKKCEHIKKVIENFLKQSSHIFFNRESERTKIFVIRILHKNMDVESKFLPT